MRSISKTLFLLVLVITVSGAFAQNSAVTNAILYHKDGDLAKAKLEIDKAVANEKTKIDPKAWYYKGLIYTDIARSFQPEVQALAPNALNDSYEAYKYAMSLDEAKKGEYYKLSDVNLMMLYSEVVNKGISSYESEKMNEALKHFEFAQQMKPQDTSAYIYASYAAESLGDDVKLKKYTEELVKLNNKSAYVYRNSIYFEADPARKLELAQKAVSEYPKEVTLIESLGDIYTSQGKYAEALKEYEKLNSLIPGNVIVLTKMALQYEKLRNREKALELYENIIAIDKENFIANYNAAIIYYERGKEQNQEIHKLNVDEYHKKGKQMEDEMKATLAKSKNYANTALLKAKEEGEKSNLDLVIAEIGKVLK